MADDKAPALGVSVQAEIEPGRTIVLQTHVDRDISATHLNEMLDKYSNALDRQQAKFAKMKLQKLLENHEARIRDTAELDAAELRKAEVEYETSGKRGPFKLLGVKETQHEQRRATIKKDQEEISKIKALIGDCDKQLAA